MVLKLKYHEFERIIDAWNFYKRSLSHDFEYDDAYHTTYKISPRFRFYAEKTNRHYKPKKLSAEKLSAEEIKNLLTFDDVEEEIII